jgi:phosphoribosylaminoimidazole carboxylase
MSSSERVGVLGGGQLGRMMAQAASRLGVSLTVLDPGGLTSPAGMVSGQAIAGSFTDPAKVRELAARCDVLTVEIEHVDAAVLAEIEAEGKVRVHPAPSTITVLQDKLQQKRHLQKVEGVRLGEFCDVPDAAALLAAGEAWGYPIMLKARTLAYDGRGNLPVRRRPDAQRITWHAAPAAAEPASSHLLGREQVRDAKAAAAAFDELSRGGAVALYAEKWCGLSPPWPPPSLRPRSAVRF